MSEAGRPRWRQGASSLLPGLRRTAILALSCNLLLELTRLVAMDGYPWRFKTPTYPVMVLLGTVVVWVVVGLVHAVVGRLRTTAALTLAATVVIAIADAAKVRLRREPLLPSDTEYLGELGFVADMVGPGFVLVLVLAALAIVGATLVGARAVARRSREGGARPPSRRGALRVLTATMCLASLAYLAGFNAPGNAARATFDALGATWRPWSQQRNYLGNGFVGGFLYNLDVPTVLPPPGYSRSAMARIAERYTEAARLINRTRRDSLREVNVVMVLSESFTDPLALDGVNLEADPIPFVRRLMARTTSGSMLAQHVGGGTANMEFEALTGMSMSGFPPQVRTPYLRLLPEHDTFPSAVRWFKDRGYRALAVHPFTTEMYRRRDVYRILGFDEFVHAETMHDQARSGRDGYISDAAAFGEVRRRLASSREPLFVNLVTMQNHMPYGDRYDDPVRVAGPDGRVLTEIGQYVRGLTYSDRALEAFLDHLDGSAEPTVVVFYGDHLPGSYPTSVFTANGGQAMHQTPFLVWANFPGQATAPPVTSPVHFVDLVLERADAPVSPYYALLQRLRHAVPARDSGMMFDPEGRRLRAHGLSPRAQGLLSDHRLVQYDLSTGRRYSLEAMLGPPR